VKSIDETLRDRRLLGAVPMFRDLSTWRPWLAFLRAFFGLAMDEHDLALFRKHTGREAPRAGGYPEAVAIVGRQSGKTAIAAACGVYAAAVAAESGQRGVFVPLVAQDLRGAQRALGGYVKEIVQSSAVLRGEVVREVSDGVELAGRVTLACYPCRPASVRGIRSAFVACDELGFFLATDGRPTDTEMLRAIRPTLATTGGRLLILSSPYFAAGALWDLHRRHWAKDSDVLIWQASAPDMNPTLPPDYLRRMEEEDPEAARAEIHGEFRSGTGLLFDPEALEVVVAPEVRERAPMPGLTYFGFADPSGGRGDAFALGIAHAVEGVAVLDCLRAWPAPFDPSAVIAEAARVLKAYGIHRVEGDRYAAEFVTERFREQGIQYDPSELDRSAIFLGFLPLVNSRSVLLLDLPELLRELRGLERRRGVSGKDRIDHRRGAHDDRANAAAGALVAAAGRRAVIAAEQLAEVAALNETVTRADRAEAFLLRTGGGSADPLNSGFRGPGGPGGWPSSFGGDL
jgi:hypothetical protein